MSDFDVWLSEHLGAQIRHLLATEPEVTRRYHEIFCGDPVARQWLTHAAQNQSATGTMPDTSADAHEEQPDEEFLARFDDQLDALEALLIEENPKFATIDPERRRELLTEVIENADASPKT